MPPDSTEATLDKPFNADAKDKERAAANGIPVGEPQEQPSDAAMRAFGLEKPADKKPPEKPVEKTGDTTPPPNPNPAQAKADAEGQTIVDKFSGKIQAHSEELYATLASRARNEDGFLDKLIASEDPMDQKMAKKILERNADIFGAGTVDEYLAKQQIEKAGDDPVQKELAQLRINQAATDKQLKEQEWKTWKAENGISPELAELADAVRKQYPPSVPYADIIHIARGRLGITNPAPLTKSSTGSPSGRSGGADTGDAIDANVAKLMRVDDPKLAQRAEKYFSQFDR